MQAPKDMSAESVSAQPVPEQPPDVKPHEEKTIEQRLDTIWNQFWGNRPDPNRTPDENAHAYREQVGQSQSPFHREVKTMIDEQISSGKKPSSELKWHQVPLPAGAMQVPEAAGGGVLLPHEASINFVSPSGAPMKPPRQRFVEELQEGRHQLDVAIRDPRNPLFLGALDDRLRNVGKDVSKSVVTSVVAGLSALSEPQQMIFRDLIAHASREAQNRIKPDEHGEYSIGDVVEAMAPGGYNHLYQSLKKAGASSTVLDKILPGLAMLPLAAATLLIDPINYIPVPGTAGSKGALTAQRALLKETKDFVMTPEAVSAMIDSVQAQLATQPGATASLLGHTYKHGFTVAIGASKQVPVEEFERRHLEEFVASREKTFQGSGGRLNLGVQTIVKDGRTFYELDASVTMPTMTQAKRLGLTQGQESVYNVFTREIVPIGERGTVDTSEESTIAAIQSTQSRVKEMNGVAGARVLDGATFDEVLGALREVDPQVTTAEAKAVFRNAKDFVGTLVEKMQPNMHSTEYGKTMREIYRLGKDGKDWYAGTATYIKETFGADSDLFARIFAATSPQTAPYANLVQIEAGTYGNSNIENAARIYLAWKTGDDVVMARFKQQYSGLEKALETLETGESFGGRKVWNYYLAVSGSDQAVVLDTHMFKAFGFQPGKTIDALFSDDAAYSVLENFVRHLADQAGVSPAQMQAGMWYGSKQLQGAKFKDDVLAYLTGRGIGPNEISANLKDMMEQALTDPAKSMTVDVAGKVRPEGPFAQPTGEGVTPEFQFGRRGGLSLRAEIARLQPDLWETSPQLYESGKTSINKSKLPEIFKKIEFEEGTINFDQGGGRHDNGTEFLHGKGVTNYIHDPYNRTPEHNAMVVEKAGHGQSDTATISNTLNVIKEEDNQIKVLNQSYDALKPGGHVYITVYYDKTKKAGPTTVGFQHQKPLEDYLPLVRAIFPDAHLEKGMIVGTKPLVEPPALSNYAAKAMDPETTKVMQTATTRPYERPSNFTVEDDALARIYDAAPLKDEKAIPAWIALRDEVLVQYDELIKTLRVERVTGQPYKTAEEMNADIAKGVMKVSTDHSEHPLWTLDENIRFRVVHDYYSHYKTGADFSLDGERNGFEHHAKLLKSEDAKKALKVEVHAQAAAALGHGGEFQEQKIFLLDDPALLKAAKIESPEPTSGMGAGEAAPPPTPPSDKGPGMPSPEDGDRFRQHFDQMDESGKANAWVLFTLARMTVGALSGAVIGDEENTLKNAIIGAGLGALMSPALLKATVEAWRGATTAGMDAAERAEYIKLAQQALKESKLDTATIVIKLRERFEQMHVSDVVHKADDPLAPYVTHTDDEVRRLATEGIASGKYSKTWIRDMAPNVPLNDVEADALSQIMTEEFLRIQALVREAHDTMNPAKLNEALERLADYALNMEPSRLSAIAASARQMRRLGVFIPDDPMSPGVMHEYLTQASLAIRDLRAGISPERLGEMIHLTPTPEHLATFSKNAIRPGWGEVLHQLWLQLLLGPITQVGNVIGNVGAIGYELGARATAELLGKTVRVGETRELLMGYGQTWKELLETNLPNAHNGFIDAFMDVLRLGGRFIEEQKAASKIDFKGHVQPNYLTMDTLSNLTLVGPLLQKLGPYGYLVDYIGAVINSLGGGMLAAGDKIFGAAAYNAELRALALRHAKEDVDLLNLNEADALRAYAKYYNDYRMNPPHSLMDDAMKYRQWTTFTGDLSGQHESSIATMRNTSIGKWITPFLGAVMKLGQFEVHYSPLPAFQLGPVWFPSYREAILRGGADAEMAQARMLFGTATMATAASWYAMGYLTGSGPVNPEDKKRMADAGWKPHAFNVSAIKRRATFTDDAHAWRAGDTLVDIDRYQPVGFLIGAGASIAEAAQHGKDSMEAVLHAAGSMMTMVGKQPFMTGMMNVTNAVNDPDRYFESNAKRYVPSLMPVLSSQMVGMVTKGIDPHVKNVQTVLDGLLAKVPGASKYVENVTDIWGEDVPTSRFSSTWKHDRATLALVENQVHMGQPSPYWNGVDIRDVSKYGHIYNEYKKLAGQNDFGTGANVKKAVEEQVDDAEWKTLTMDERAVVLQSIFHDYRAMARNEILENPKNAVLAADVEKATFESKRKFNPIHPSQYSNVGVQ